MATTMERTELTFKEKIEIFGGTDGIVRYSKQKKFKKTDTPNLILTTKQTLNKVSTHNFPSKYKEDKYPKNISFELIESIDHNKSNPPNPTQTKKQISPKTNYNFAYNELFGNNYDANGDLMIGKITCSDFSNKQKKVNNNIQIENSNSTNLISQHSATINSNSTMDFDINSIFDMSEIDSIINNLDIKYDENMNEYDYESDEYSIINEENSDQIVIYSDAIDIDNISIQSNEVIETQKRFDDMLKEIECDKIGDDEKAEFDQKRKYEMNELMYGMFDSEDSEYISDFIPEPLQLELKTNVLTLRDLMERFKLNTNDGLYEYYNKTLNIIYANELVNYYPKIITQPEKYKSTKKRMFLCKMGQYVTNKVINNEWDGSKSKEWMELELNMVYRIFGSAQYVSSDTIDVTPVINTMESSELYKDLYFENDNNKSNRIKIIGNLEVFIDKKIESETNVSVNIKMESMPYFEGDSYEQNIVMIGIMFYDINNKIYDMIYITDRCGIYRNNSYLTMLSLYNCKMFENDSEIILNINTMNDYEPIVEFKHLQNGKLYKYNEKKIVLDNISLENNKYSYAKIFIHQVYGEGIYSIYELLS